MKKRRTDLADNNKVKRFLRGNKLTSEKEESKGRPLCIRRRLCNTVAACGQAVRVPAAATPFCFIV
ncbi:MAG: hypothetical protein ONB48_05060 [candidate division KSB1 bacterium]|nr:hypothetical protein [candidate division KSB1 bacterium]MDZ7276561.1 hypothetical protein [candidate division KSB1 bacterium]MDZ7285020.1 hypothetical protein [candidate division KSB1 bacterium]MDZ7298052.1 hypothetical protein [candidate division KSB1 bacterium]MDZ7307440.1 hypothetical protein [candidate division KSB1 bacterium]